MTTSEIVLMFIKSIPALLLVFVIWPLGLGIGFGLKKNIDRYIIGFCTVQAIFFLCYIPAILNAWSSRTLTAVGAITISLIAIGGAALRFAKTDEKNEFLALKIPDFNYLRNPFFLGALIIIVYELYIYVFKEPWIYGDDVSYMTRVTRFVDTNSIYTKSWVGQVEPSSLREVSVKAVLTSYYPFVGMISIISGLHPLILCKTIIPLIYLPTHYLIVWRICDYLFREGDIQAKIVERRSLFIFIYAILIEFGHISYYTLSRRVTIWIYNSKSDCFCLILISLFFYTYLLLLEKTEDVLFNNSLGYRFLVITTIILACNSSSLMGVLMSIIVIGIWYVIATIKKRDYRFVTYGLLTFLPHIITVLLIVSFIR